MQYKQYRHYIMQYKQQVLEFTAMLLLEFVKYCTSFLFKLFPIFPYVNSQDEISALAKISPCNQPLRPVILFVLLFHEKVTCTHAFLVGFRKIFTVING